VKSTAEQLEAKRKEKEKKLQIYRSTMAQIFDKVCGFRVSFVCQVGWAMDIIFVRHLSFVNSRGNLSIMFFSQYLWFH